MVVDLVRLIDEFKQEIREELRLQRKILTSLLDTLEEAKGQIPDSEIEERLLSCPDCGESREDKLEETGAMDNPNRITCLNCGISFSYSEVK